MSKPLLELCFTAHKKLTTSSSLISENSANNHLLPPKQPTTLSTSCLTTWQPIKTTASPSEPYPWSFQATLTQHTSTLARYAAAQPPTSFFLRTLLFHLIMDLFSQFHKSSSASCPLPLNLKSQLSTYAPKQWSHSDKHLWKLDGPRIDHQSNVTTQLPLE